MTITLQFYLALLFINFEMQLYSKIELTLLDSSGKLLQILGCQTFDIWTFDNRTFDIQEHLTPRHLTSRNM